jgi:hypothetical protein
MLPDLFAAHIAEEDFIPIEGTTDLGWPVPGTVGAADQKNSGHSIVPGIRRETAFAHMAEISRK